MFSSAFSLDIYSLLNLLGIVHGIFLIFLLINKKENSLPNRFMIYLLLLVLFFQVDCLMLYTKFVLKHPYLAFFSLPLSFTIGPLMYFHSLSVIQPVLTFKKPYLLNLIPFGLYLVLITIPYLLSGGANQLEILSGMYSDPSVRIGNRIFMVLLNLVTFTHILIYFVVAYRLLIKASSSPDVRLTSLRKSYYQGIKTILKALGIIWLIWVYIAFFLDNVLLEFSIMPAIFSIMIYALGYWGVRQPELFTLKEKYESSVLTQKKKDIYLEKLQQAMTVEKLHHDENITLQSIAKTLSIPANYLSQTINEEFDQNFPDFINTHRIDEAKELLKDPIKSYLSILGIAYEVGFNSKSVFYTAFKKHTGMSPSQFQKQF